MTTDQDVAFPILAEEDLAALESRGRRRDVRAGEVLFRAGERGFSFYVVLDGAIDIVDTSREDEPLITTHRASQFTGDVDMLTGRIAVVTARAAEDSRLLELSADQLRLAVDQVPRLTDVIVRAFLMRRQLLLGSGFALVQIIGSRYSAAAHRLRDFATRNQVPVRWVDLETDQQAEAVLRHLGIKPSETPVVLGRGKLKRNPSLEEFAQCAGLTATLEDDHVYDLVVAGAGPAGLAASVYAASEGLDVLTAESNAPGGQAGTSLRIENYLGFPAGISGQELTRNATLQAQRFGARITVPCVVNALGLSGGERLVTLGDGRKVRTRCVLVATGVRYRRLDVPRFGDFEAAGIYYAATEMEARLCRGEEVVVVGGGNSAGQAAVHLARSARRVHLLCRGPDLAASMSRYLVDQISAMGNVVVRQRTQVVGVEGNGHLGAVRIRTGEDAEDTIATGALFLFIGADPNTNWLRGCVALDRSGFVLTGPQLPQGELETEGWRAVGRPPFLLETSQPGVFAAGDVRSGSVKRCASAVGEGSMAVSFMHAHIRPV